MSSGKSSGVPIGLPARPAGGRRAPSRPRSRAPGSANAAMATAPAPCAVSVMKRRRVTVSPSKAPGHPAVGGVLGLGLFPSVGHGGREQYRRAAKSGAPGARAGRSARWRGGAQRAAAPARRRARRPSPPPARRPPWPTAATPAAHTAAARSASPSAWACAASEITSASSATASRSPSSASRARPSAYRRSPASSARSGSSGRTTRPVAVVLEVALDDRLDEQRVVLLAAGGARPGRRGGAERAVVRCGRRSRWRPAGRRRPRRSRPARRARSVMRSPRTRRRRPRACASTCSGVCASDGNQASNCDGGG